MKVSITFNPAEDNSDDILKIVASVYGVESQPIKIMASDAPATNAPAVTGPEAVKQFVRDTLAANPGGIPPQVTASQTTVLADVTGTQPATLEGASVNQVEVDITGLPWDGRIHVANGDRKTKAGTWKRKKGTTTEEREAIEAELRASLNNLPTPINRVELPAAGVLANSNVPTDTVSAPVAGQALPSIEQQPATVSPQIIVQTDQPQVAATIPAQVQVQTEQPQAPVATTIAVAGRFANLLTFLRAENNSPQYCVSALTNEVSACLGENVLTLDDLGRTAGELTGQPEASPSAFFSLIAMSAFWDRIAAALDAVIASKAA